MSTTHIQEQAHACARDAAIGTGLGLRIIDDLKPTADVRAFFDSLDDNQISACAVLLTCVMGDIVLRNAEANQ